MTGPPVRTVPAPTTGRPTTPNPLLGLDAELLGRLAAFRLVVNDLLLDKLAAATLRDPAFRARECPHPLEDVKAAAQVARVLAKPSWDADDLEILDVCWRQAMQSALFGEEFEADRHRLRRAVDEARKELAGDRRAPARGQL